LGVKWKGGESSVSRKDVQRFPVTIAYLPSREKKPKAPPA